MESGILSFCDESGILLDQRLGGVAEQGYARQYGTSQTWDISGNRF